MRNNKRPDRQQSYRLPDQHIVICAWCGRERHDDRWQPGGPRSEQHSISHGICPDCLDQQLARFTGRRSLMQA